MTLKTLMISAAISALMAGGAVAQTATDAPAADGTTAPAADSGVANDAVAAPEFTSISDMTVGDLVGKNVYDTNGDTIGDVDYVIDRDGGGLAVIGIGGFLGMGQYTVALPVSDFNYDTSQQMVTLDTTKDALKEQPEFKEDNVDKLPDETPLADLISTPGGSGTDSPALDGTDSTVTDPALDTDTEMGTGSDSGLGSDTDTGTDTGSDLGTGSDMDHTSDPAIGGTEGSDMTTPDDSTGGSTGTTTQ
ncbi:MAG: PRC-barrel domain-containing protein [Rhodobacterales bacterium]|nr:PRC-barrel domain-containing protein [Rhodobacterales bacterium]